MATGKTDHPLAILLVDDEPAVRRILREMLLHRGCRVDTAESAAQAVKAFLGQRYDLVLVDCRLPVQEDGRAAGLLRAREAKDQAGAGRVPIVGITDLVPEEPGPHDRTGLDDCLEKPVTLARIDALLARWQPASPGGTPAPPAQDSQTLLSPREPAFRPPNPDGAPIDQNALAVIAALQPGGEGEILQRIVSLYLDSAGKLVSQIREAVLAGDAAKLHRAAHTLKSSSATLGARRLAEISRELETAGTGPGVAVPPERLAELVEEFSRVRQALAQGIGQAPPGSLAD